VSRSRSHCTPGLPPEPQGLQGDLFGMSRRVRPFDAICHPQQPCKAGGLSGSKGSTVVNYLANFFRLWDQSFSGSAKREARTSENASLSASVGSSPSDWKTDLFECQLCHEKSRDWIIATVGNGESICRACWPRFARMRYGKREKLSCDGNGGACATCTPCRSSRKYVMKDTYET